jgi:hypothetical protein
MLTISRFCGVNVIAYYSSAIFVDSGFSELSALAASLGFGVINWLFAIPAIYVRVMSITLSETLRSSMMSVSDNDRLYSNLEPDNRYFWPTEFVTDDLPIDVDIPVFHWFQLLDSCHEHSKSGLCCTRNISFWHCVQPWRRSCESGTAILCLLCVGVNKLVLQVPFTYSAEAYPLYVRTYGMSLATATTWFFNFVLSITWPSMLVAFTPQGGFAWYAVWNIIGWWGVLTGMMRTTALVDLVHS